MDSSSLVLLIHLIGLALGVGAGTVKLILLLKGYADHSFLPTFFKVSKLITRTIVAGVVILTLSGITWLLLGYDLTPVLIVKIILVAGVWGLGITIDNAVEPRFQKLAPAPGEASSTEFVRIQRLHLGMEIAADGLFYLIMILWVLQ